jgi:uncharacterized protein
LTATSRPKHPDPWSVPRLPAPSASVAVKIWVTAKPWARQAAVREIAEGEYIVFVLAPAREGKANQAIIETLAAHFCVPNSAVKILRGERSRRKLVEIG